jgi:tetrahydromethanopterin S-methyltransferase subunit E
MFYAKYGGKIIEEVAKFCAKCGNPLTGVATE